MTSVNYLEVYRLEPSMRKSSRIRLPSQDGFALDEAADDAMGFTAGDNIYRVHRRKRREKVLFSTDRYHDPSTEILVLSLRKRTGILRSKTTPIVALRYQAVKDNRKNSYGIYWEGYPDWNNDPENYLGVCYVQTLTGIDHAAYTEAEDALGTYPHEFLVAHFLSRAAPILDARPETKVVFGKRKSSTSQKAIRDRFFDRRWRLNPEKERVKQILGLDNAWLRQEAIQTRRRS